jgi:cytochrome c oxidase assembly protein subunit 15
MRTGVGWIILDTDMTTLATAETRPDGLDARTMSVASRGMIGLRLWIVTLAVLVFGMVVVGGATRMTGSGLSITEWKPVTGAMPPLNETTWLVEFDKYRSSPQYQLLNQGMSLSEFKEIYWWEWSHRQFGRLIGVVFGVGFVVFAGAGVLRGKLLLAVGALGLLGALQAAIGWIMVASGLKPGMTAVAPVKLMLHLVTASLIFSGLVAVAVELARTSRETASAAVQSLGEPDRRLRRAAGVILALTLLQIGLGALVAGSRAGLTYNTWPLMDGVFIPSLEGLFIVRPLIENFADNPLTVQFNHRMVAYALFAVVLWHAFAAWRSGAAARIIRRAAALAGLVTAQAGIGIATLLLQVPLALGLLHQAFAILVLGMATAHWRLSRA